MSGKESVGKILAASMNNVIQAVVYKRKEKIKKTVLIFQENYENINDIDENSLLVVIEILDKGKKVKLFLTFNKICFRSTGE